MLSIVLAAPVERLFEETFLLPTAASYIGSLGATTAALVFFGEILPKVLVVRSSEAFARFAAVPMYLVDRMLTPLRNGVIHLTGFMFRVTRFSEVRPAPFMTDEEFLSLITEGEASGVIETEERQMIQGILEFNEVMLRELKVPRPDMVALKTDTTVKEALEVVRERHFSRMPVFEEDVDHIRGILYAKDLLPSLERGEVDKPIQDLMRRPHFVPETMSVAEFVKMAQKRRTHLAIVVDEFGGTEGLITLEDALREVVGEMGDERHAEKPSFVETEGGAYIVEGNFPLDDLQELTGVSLENEAHLTVAGFVMEMTDKIPEQGDQIAVEDVVFTVEEVDGKRVSQVKIEVPDREVPVEPTESVS
jgi:CBS domain containing-hemolysin-like protein